MKPTISTTLRELALAAARYVRYHSPATGAGAAVLTLIPNLMPHHPGNTTLPTAHLAELLCSAFDYALGRQTYVASEVAAHLQTYWHCLPEEWQQRTKLRIQAVVGSGRAGSEEDAAEWRKLLALPVGEK